MRLDGRRQSGKYSLESGTSPLSSYRTPLTGGYSSGIHGSERDGNEPRVARPILGDASDYCFLWPAYTGLFPNISHANNMVGLLDCHTGYKTYVCHAPFSLSEDLQDKVKLMMDTQRWRPWIICPHLATQEVAENDVWDRVQDLYNVLLETSETGYCSTDSRVRPVHVPHSRRGPIKNVANTS